MCDTCGREQKHVKHVPPTLYGQGSHTLLWAASRVARKKITVKDLANLLHCFVIFIMNTQFKHVAAYRGLLVQNI
jgi:hypothetical protein